MYLQNKTTVITVRLTEKQNIKLSEFAKKNKISKSDAIRLILDSIIK